MNSDAKFFRSYFYFRSVINQRRNMKKFHFKVTISENEMFHIYHTFR